MATVEQHIKLVEPSVSNKSILAHTNLVQQASGISSRPTNNNREQVSDVTGNQQKPSIVSQVKISNSAMLENNTETSGFQKETNNIINAV